jgi:hypothetical protein
MFKPLIVIGKAQTFEVAHVGCEERYHLQLTPLNRHMRLELFFKGSMVSEQYLTLEEIFSARSILVEVRK